MGDKSRGHVRREPMVRRAAGYDELWKRVDFRTLDIPEQFNLGVACLDDQDPEARALTIVSPDRSSRDYTFGQLADQANRRAAASPQFAPVTTRAEDPAFLIYTSGTTGD